MSRIFISYRRADAQGSVGRLYDRLEPHFGAEQIFMDISTIPLGMDFRQVIIDEVSQCAILLAVIGDRWLTMTGEDGRRRLDDPADFVRLEIAAALERDIPVVPVLVQGAQMPTEAQLPKPLKPLVYRNAIEVTHARFDADVARLIQGLEQLSEATALPVTSNPPPLPMPVTLPTRPSIDILPPPFAWIEIPAGHLTIDWNDQHDVTAFEISKYPITNAQYKRFIDAGGYREQRWWIDLGWREQQKGNWTRPRFWKDKKFNGPDQPVVGVSWYEAMACCQWLSEVSGEVIMLPTEQQWQRAAQGDDGREYPWGNEWDGARCNNSVPITTPVQQYEGRGDSPFGVVDMAGNVWEWCLTAHESGNDDLTETGWRVLKGGSWNLSSPAVFRVTYRSGNEPHVRHNLYGFRIVRSR